jgi:uncharacterized protein (UPF0248 family)
MSEQTKRILEIFEEIKWQVEADFRERTERASVEAVRDADRAAMKKVYDEGRRTGDYAKGLDDYKISYEAEMAVLENNLKEIVLGAVQKLKLNTSEEDVETLYMFFKKNKAESLRKDYGQDKAAPVAA